MSNDKYPVLKDGSIDHIYEELGKLYVELDADPLVYGPKRLNGKIASSRKMLGRCEEIFLQVSHDLSRFTRALRLVETELSLRKNDLFANDPHVRSGRNVADREALAAVKLKSLVEKRYALASSEEELKATLVVVKAKRADLRDAAGRLRDQIRLCQEELGLGSHWGSKVPNAPDIKPTGIAVESSVLDTILSEVGETHLPQNPEWKGESKGQFQSPLHPDAGDDDQAGAIAKPVPAAPRCPVCGKPQRETSSGWVCSNGHGEGLPAESDPTSDPDPEPEMSVTPLTLGGEGDVEAASVLPATSSEDEIEAFLSDLEPAPQPRRTQRDLDSDLDDLLSAFGG